MSGRAAAGAVLLAAGWLAGCAPATDERAPDGVVVIRGRGSGPAGGVMGPDGLMALPIDETAEPRPVRNDDLPPVSLTAEPVDVGALTD